MSDLLNGQSGMTRRGFIKAGAAAVAATAAAPRRQAAAIGGQSRPNILFLHVDQLSLDTIGVHGCADVQTPNIDRIARRGVTFLNSYSTDPVCCPARACWFTGRAACETGVTNNSMKLRPGMPDLGQWLRKGGYQTFYTGKWHIPGRDVSKSFNVLSSGAIGEQGDDNVALTAQSFLRGYREADPFFFSIGFLNPHDICNWWATYTMCDGEFPYPELLDRLPAPPPNFNVKPNEIPTYSARSAATAKLTAGWSDEMWRFYLWSYHRYVEMVDGAIGRVLDALESSPHSRNTLLLFSSDHGDAHIHHRHTQKTLLYDSVCKVPMMASWPEALPEGVADAAHLVSGLDVTPTICDFAGIAPPPAMRGLSLRPALEERPVEWRDFLVSSSLGRGRMIRTADWKLIRFEGENEMQLFDSPNDPYEMHELSRGSNRFDTAIAELAKALGEYEASLDPAPLPPAPAAGARGARRQANAEE